MKKVVTQMIGCLNVLSRLKKPGIRIMPPMMNELFVRSSALLATYVDVAIFFSGQPHLKRWKCPNRQCRTCYSHNSTVSFSILVNFEHFGWFLGRPKLELPVFFAR